MQNHINFFLSRGVIFLCLFFLNACSNKSEVQKKAEDIVKKSVLENIDDPNTYENIFFSKLDTMTYEKRMKELENVDYLVAENDTIQHNPNEIIELSISHKFRIIKHNEKILKEYYFVFDSLLTIKKVNKGKSIL